MDIFAKALDRYKTQPKSARSARDEVIRKFVDAINADRTASGYRKLPASAVASLINRHPILGQSVEECWYVYNECIRSGHFKKFWWTVKNVDNSVDSKFDSAIF
jgi:hypothetical protein